MSLTLGEKLRQAREERGFTLSEVADQTRISGLYLESIEKDEYRSLPGGIFNKGFVKSYAKFVGVNEEEALADYAALIGRSDSADNAEPKPYKPEVLTDGPGGSSNAPTIIMAVVILGLMTAGVLFLVDYLRRPQETIVSNSVTKPDSNSNSAVPDASPGDLPSNLPDIASVKIEFAAVGQPIPIVATKDGVKSDTLIAAGTSQVFEPKESLTLNYNRWNAQAAQLTINGKPITLPSEPLKTSTDKRRIEFTITRENLGQVWMDGAISSDAPASAVPDSNSVAATANTTPTPNTNTQATARPTPATSPTAKPQTNTNNAPKPSPSRAPKTPAPATPRPAPTTET